MVTPAADLPAGTGSCHGTPAAQPLSNATYLAPHPAVPATRWQYATLLG